MSIHVSSFVLVAVLALNGQQPPRSPQAIADDLRKLAAEVEELQIPATPPEQLSAALALGGEIHLQPGVIYPIGLVVRVSGTKIYYDGAVSKVVFGSAFEILPGVHDVDVFKFNGNTDDKQRVVLCGHNDATQTTVDLVPKRIRFVQPIIQGYLGKRAIEVNCGVEIDTPVITMIGSTLGQDTQGIGVSNTPGPVWIHGAQITGGIEGLMIGGDTVKIPGVVQSDVTLEDFSLYLGLDNRGKGYGYKNRLEVKACERCIFRRGVLDGSFQDGQIGFAVVVTPRSGGYIRDVLFEDLKIRNVAGGFNVLGLTNVAPPTLQPTSKVVIRRVDVVASEPLGRPVGATLPSSMGIFAQIGGSAVDVSIQDSKFSGDGPSFISIYQGGVLNQGGTTVAGDPMQLLSVTGSTFTALKYGILIWGVAHAGPTQKGVLQLTVTGNTITGASAALKKNLPSNTFQ